MNETNYGFRELNPESKLGKWSKNKSKINLKQREWDQNPYLIEEKLKEYQKNQNENYLQTNFKNNSTQKEKSEDYDEFYVDNFKNNIAQNVNDKNNKEDNLNMDEEMEDSENIENFDNIEIMIKCIDNSDFYNSWLSQWLKYRIMNDRISEESKKYWTLFCFEYGKSILNLEKYITNRDDKKQFRIFVMKTIESNNPNENQRNSNYFLAKSKPLLPQSFGITSTKQSNQKLLPSFEQLFLKLKGKIEEYVGFKLSYDLSEDLKKKVGYESMQEITDDTIQPLIKIKKQEITKKINPMNSDNTIQNREEPNIDLHHIPLSRRTINNAQQPNRDKYRLVRESFS